MEERPKCAYIVAETACLYPTSGAGKHIRVGMEELAKVFEVELVLFCKPWDNSVSVLNAAAQTGRQRKGPAAALKTFLRRWLKWWYILFSNHRSFLKYYRTIRDRKPDFIYERSAYLNYNGLLIARLLKIPHCYEVNGINARDHASRYMALYNWISFHLERRAYRSTLSFFVGGLNTEMGIPESDRAVVIQNGIDENFLDGFRYHSGRTGSSDKKVNLVFVGHAMDHHRLDIFFEALRKISHSDRLRVHLIGSNFAKYDELFARLPVEVVNHGIQEHDALRETLKKMDAGIVPFALDYHSNMKVFLYGAARLVVLLPETRNFKRLFDAGEAIFFENGDPQPLAKAIDRMVELFGSGDTEIREMTDRLFEKVRNEYVWPAIYKDIIRRINHPRHEGAALTSVH
ncbi:MAG: glycosyltransferase family 4 protein [Bacteroidetes bacterium]|nr:glycosyltransferase family 4 protein [Bacteroidota bacterium]